MSLEMYLDDAKTTPLLRENVFTALTAIHTLDGLTAMQVQTIYKYTGTAYVILSPSSYDISGTTLTLTTALTVGQHIVVMPINHLNMVFTGLEGASKTVDQKLVFFKGDTTTVYDAMSIYSEDLTSTTPVDIKETISGFSSFVVDTAMAIYRSNSVVDPVTGIGFTVAADISTINLEDCAVIVNGQYVGDVWATDYISTIVMPTGTTFTTTGISDIIQIVSTGSLRFATGALGDVKPASNAFKRCLSLPTLTLANRTAYVWMTETVSIPTYTIESPSMPFKLIGQTYTE